jgi:hypothetical protein
MRFACPAWVTARFRLHVLGWAVLSLLAYGLAAAIIPNPLFGRQIAPEPFAVAIWLVSAPLMGFLGATYSAAPAAATQPLQIVALGPAATGGATMPSADDTRSSLLGAVGGFGAFLAIGCPVCNKIALLLLGASGAVSVWAPIQPVLGTASLALLAATVVWRSRQISRGAVCAV